MMRGVCVLAGATWLAGVAVAAGNTINVPANFPTIQAAISAALDGDEIVVAPGTYNQNIDFLGKAITVRSSAGAAATTISASGTVVTCDDFEGPDTVLDGFTITGGNAVEGGGMLMEFSHPTVRNCTFTNNTATRGGGMFMVGSTATIETCVFSGNHAINSGNGGAMYSNASSPVIADTTFCNNAANDQGGAGYFTNFSNVSLSGCTFDGNSATLFGGALVNASFSDTQMADCFFGANTVTAGTSSAGGAIYNSQSNPTMTSCVFTQNSASVSCCNGGRGGAIYNTSSSPTLADCTFTTNSASGAFSGGHGGAVYNENSSPIVDGCLFTGNSAISTNNSSNNALGGAVFTTSGGTTTLTNCTFDGNLAGGTSSNNTRLGGAIYNSTGLTLRGCSFSGNSAEVNGGAVYSTTAGTNVKISDCTFAENIAVLGSGIYNFGDAYIANCMFLGNITGVSGGIYNDNADPTIVNCLFSGNFASSFGGGIFNFSDADPIIVNCTFSENTAFAGAGIHNFSTTSNPTIQNCIVWGNSNTSGASIAGNGIPTVTFSDIEGGFAGGNIDADPIFVDPDGLDDIPGTDDDDLRLVFGSPCMESGNNAALPPDAADLDGDTNTAEPMPIDLDGNGRIVDGDLSGLATIDMGAYERRVTEQCPWDLGGNGSVGTNDFLSLLQQWGTDPGGPPDFDGNGTVGTPDFLALLQHWGPCP